MARKRKDDYSDDLTHARNPVRQLEATQGERLAFSWKDLEERKRRSNKFLRYVHGDPPPQITDAGKGRTDDSRLTEAQKEARALGKGWIVATMPFLGMMRAAIMSSLIARKATWTDMQKEVPGGIEDPEILDGIEKFNGLDKIFRELAKVIDERSNVRQKLRAGTDDCLSYSVGWLEADVDAAPDARGIGRIRWESASRVMVDLEADSDPLGELQRWRAVAWAVPIDEAEWLLKNVWGKGEDAWARKGHKFQALTHTDLDNETRKIPTKMCRLVRVYKRGDSPWASTEDLSAEAGEAVEAIGDDPVYKNGEDEVLIFEAQGDLQQKDCYKLIARFPYPYPCDFPLEPIILTDDNSCFYKPPLYQMGYSMCVAANGAIRNYNTKAFQLARMFIGYSTSAFNKKTFEAAFKGPDAMNLVPFDKPGDIRTAFQSMQMGDVPQFLENLIGMDTSLFKEAAALDIYELEQRSHQPATNAALQDAQKQLRLDDMAYRVERAYQNVMEKALVACSKWMSAEDVAYHIGDEYMGWYEEGGVRKSKYWDDEIDDPVKLRERVNIRIEPRSVRFVGPEQEIADIERYTTKVMEFSAQVTAAKKEGLTDVAMAIAKMGNAALADYADKLHLAHRADLGFDLTLLATPPEPQPGEVPMETVSQEMGPDGSRSMETTAPAGGNAAMNMMQRLQGQGMGGGPDGEMQQAMRALDEMAGGGNGA